MTLFILDDNKNPIQVDFDTWSEWYRQRENRIVAKTDKRGILVSTVFLPDGMFETMVFTAGEPEDAQYVCRTYEEAKRQHHRACVSLGMEISVSNIWLKINEI